MPSVQTTGGMYGTREISASINSDGVPVVEIREGIKVTLDNGGSGAEVAAYAAVAAIRPLRSAHQHFAAARVKDFRGRPDSNDDKLWEFIVEYDTETKTQDEQDQEQPDNPLDEQPDVEWDSELFSRPLNEDAIGTAVENSAGEPFDPLPEVDDARNVLRVTRNEAANPVNLAADYANVINTDNFLGWGPGKVKAAPLRASRQTKRLKDGTLQVYWRCIYEFHFKPKVGDRENWLVRVLDQGYRTLEDDTLTGNLDSADMPLAKPVKLDGQGGRLAEGVDPAFRVFFGYRQKSFAAFNMNSSLILGA